MTEEFKKKAENFWYYYKWRILVPLFILVFFAFAIINQVLTHVNYDYKIMLVTNDFVPDTFGAGGVNELDNLKSALKLYGRDLNGDGKVNIEILFVSSKQNSVDNFIGARTKLMTAVQLGEVMLFISDQVMYDELCKLGVPEPVETPEGEAKGFNWKDSELRRTAGLERYPDDLYFTVRVISENIKNVKGIEEKQEQALELLNNIMNNLIVTTPTQEK